MRNWKRLHRLLFLYYERLINKDCLLADGTIKIERLPYFRRIFKQKLFIFLILFIFHTTNAFLRVNLTICYRKFCIQNFLLTMIMILCDGGRRSSDDIFFLRWLKSFLMTALLMLLGIFFSQRYSTYFTSVLEALILINRKESFNSSQAHCLMSN